MDTETMDLVRLLRRFGVRALALAAVAALVGYTTVAMALALVGFGLLFARPKVRKAGVPEGPARPGSSEPGPGQPGGSRG
ncbi:hypothetical protein [Amycolatopsis sp. NPDC051372]|uniref:hypothetical protein n=1 Tax=unclassified Amycolatopsis TaxID=2618356 RepID=UPI00341B5BA4